VVPYGERVTFTVVASSSFPSTTQVWSRVSSGAASDSFTVPATGQGTLYLIMTCGRLPTPWRFTWGATRIRLCGRGHDERHGVLELSYAGSPWATHFQVVVTTAEGGESDGWSYQAVKVTSPLSYRWYKQDEEWRTLVAQGPTYHLDPVLYCHAGTTP